jgi:hypothetical protein
VAAHSLPRQRAKRLAAAPRIWLGSPLKKRGRHVAWRSSRCGAASGAAAGFDETGAHKPSSGTPKLRWTNSASRGLAAAEDATAAASWCCRRHRRLPDRQSLPAQSQQRTTDGLSLPARRGKVDTHMQASLVVMPWPPSTAWHPRRARSHTTRAACTSAQTPHFARSVVNCLR